MAATDTTQTTPTRGYSATKDQLLKRLRRVEGQVRGVQGMVDDDRYCIDVITQISAIQAALDKVALGLLDEHASRRRSITPSMLGSITTCSITSRSPTSVTRPAASRAMTPRPGTSIEAAISAFARRPCPR